MNNNIVIGALFLFALNYTFLNAQTADTEKLWNTGGFATLNITQISLVNWSAGGENSFSTTFIGNTFATYNKDNVSWENSLDLAYGIVRTGKEWRKGEDKLEVNSKFGYKVDGGKFLYTVLTNFKTQFDKGYNYPNDSDVVSRFVAPAYLLVSAGLDYKPVDYFSIYLSPATGKFTFVNDQSLADEGAYGVDPAVYDEQGILITHGKKIRPEFGAYFKAQFQKDIFKNINLMTMIDLFDNYTDSDKGNRKNIDINWQTDINIKANKFLSTTLTTNLIYDHNTKVELDENGDGQTDLLPNGDKKTGPRTQFKEVLGVGLSYKF